MAFNWMNDLLNKQILQTATQVPLTQVHEQAVHTKTRTEFILYVLNASRSLRISIAEVARQSGSAGQIQLAGIIDVYNSLSPEKQVDFRRALKVCSSIQGTGGTTIARRIVYEPGHHPPINPP